jgi:hypothetical protein
MSDDDLPEDIRRFILEKIDSVIQMEALLLFLSDPQAAWPASAIGGRLYISVPEAYEMLAALKDRGFLKESGGQYVYGPASPELAEIVARAAETYRHHLIPFTRFVHEKPKIQQFADAFRIRKDKP